MNMNKIVFSESPVSENGRGKKPGLRVGGLEKKNEVFLRPSFYCLAQIMAKGSDNPTFFFCNMVRRRTLPPT